MQNKTSSHEEPRVQAGFWRNHFRDGCKYQVQVGLFPFQGVCVYVCVCASGVSFRLAEGKESKVRTFGLVQTHLKAKTWF